MKQRRLSGARFAICMNNQDYPVDIENIPKLIIDAFSAKLIAKDHSRYTHVGLYSDDTIEYVRIVKSQLKEATQIAQQLRYSATEFVNPSSNFLIMRRTLKCFSVRRIFLS